MSQQAHIKITVSFAWWIKPYLRGIALTCAVTGMEPDWDKVSAMIRRATRLKLS